MAPYPLCVMKFPVAPRQPFLGLVLAAVIGIIVADFWPIPFAPIQTALTLGLLGLVLVIWPRLSGTYLFVTLCFFSLHIFQTTETAGQWLEARLGNGARAVKVSGAIVSEPKVTSGGAATFLLRLASVSLEDKTEKTNATILVRWRGVGRFGDELTLFGIAAPIDPPRNPGEFDI